MNLDNIADLWQELKRHITVVEHSEASDTLVAFLIDNDIDPGEIKQAFKNDVDVKAALQSYIEDSDGADESDEFEDTDFEDDEY
jgi:hypothetical protein